MQNGRHPRVGSQEKRRGAVTVEFAVVAPVFVALALGIMETSSYLDAQNMLLEAVRDGVRVAAMERQDILDPDETMLEKITDDVRNFMNSQGVPSQHITVQALNELDDGIFDLDDPANERLLFRLKVSVPYGAFKYGDSYVPQAGDQVLTAEITFRNAKTTLVN